jgi:hypothetical protein
MAQRILEPGEIETLASRDVPRIILPDTASLFAGRAARLRSLAAHSAIGGYLQLLAALADAQQALLDELTPQQRETLQAQARAQQSSAAPALGCRCGRPTRCNWMGTGATGCARCASTVPTRPGCRRKPGRNCSALPLPTTPGWMHRRMRCWSVMTRRRWMRWLHCW